MDIYAYAPKMQLAGSYLRLSKYRLFLSGDKTEILMTSVGVDDLNIGTGGVAVITTLVASDYAPTCGASVTLTATLVGIFGLGDPTGTITFYNGSTVIGSGTVSSGTVAITVTGLPAGTNSIHAVYSGDIHYLPSTSASISVVVGNIATTTLLIALPNPVDFGDEVTFIAEMTPTPVVGTKVNFFVDTALLGIADTDITGIAFVSTSTLSIGSHQVYAAFTGGACYAASTSNTITEVVGASSSSSSSGSPGCFAFTLTSSGFSDGAYQCTQFNGTFTLYEVAYQNEYQTDQQADGSYWLLTNQSGVWYLRCINLNPPDNLQGLYQLASAPTWAIGETITANLVTGAGCVFPASVSLQTGVGPCNHHFDVVLSFSDSGSGDDSAFSIAADLSFSDSGTGADSVQTSSSSSSSSSQPQVATPTFSPVAGSYGPPQTVTISCATGGASIYYTTDGSTPTPSSTLYTAPITVSVTETVKAIGVLGGYTNSNVGSAAYTITYILYDIFNDTNGTLLTAHTMNVGPGWSAQPIPGDGSGDDAVIQSNTLQDLSAGTSLPCCWSDAGGGHTDGQADVYWTAPATTNAILRVLGRVTDQNNHWYFQINGSSGALELAYYIAGTPTVQATGSASGFTANGTYKLSLNFTGSMAIGSISGTGITGTVSITATNAQWNTKTAWGLMFFVAGATFPSGQVTQFVFQ